MSVFGSDDGKDKNEVFRIYRRDSRIDCIIISNTYISRHNMAHIKVPHLHHRRDRHINHYTHADLYHY